MLAHYNYSMSRALLHLFPSIGIDESKFVNVPSKSLRGKERQARERGGRERSREGKRRGGEEERGEGRIKGSRKK